MGALFQEFTELILTELLMLNVIIIETFSKQERTIILDHEWTEHVTLW